MTRESYDDTENQTRDGRRKAAVPTGKDVIIDDTKTHPKGIYDHEKGRQNVPKGKEAAP